MPCVGPPARISRRAGRRRALRTRSIGRSRSLRQMFRLAKRARKISDVPDFPMVKEDNARTGFFESEQLGRAQAPTERLRGIATIGSSTRWRRKRTPGGVAQPRSQGRRAADPTSKTAKGAGGLTATSRAEAGDRGTVESASGARGEGHDQPVWCFPAGARTACARFAGVESSNRESRVPRPALPPFSAHGRSEPHTHGRATADRDGDHRAQD